MADRFDRSLQRRRSNPALSPAPSTVIPRPFPARRCLCGPGLVPENLVVRPQFLHDHMLAHSTPRSLAIPSHAALQTAPPGHRSIHAIRPALSPRRPHRSPHRPHRSPHNPRRAFAPHTIHPIRRTIRIRAVATSPCSWIPLFLPSSPALAPPSFRFRAQGPSAPPKQPLPSPAPLLAHPHRAWGRSSRSLLYPDTFIIARRPPRSAPGLVPRASPARSRLFSSSSVPIRVQHV